MATPEEEARAHPRYAVEIDAQVRCASSVHPVRTRDVSRGGLCFLVSEALPLGAELAMTMALVFDEATFSEPIQIRARVVWCTPFGERRYQVGTSFVGLTTEGRAYLEMFLRYLKEGLARDRAREPRDAEEEEFG